MKSRGVLCAFAFGAVALPSAAQAVDITVAPRMWYLVDALASGDLPATNGTNGTYSFTSPPFDVLMKGASVSAHFDTFLPKTNFTLTGLYGSDGAYLTTRGSNVITTPSGRQQLISSTQHTREFLHRGDFEFTAQTRINDLLSWTVGVRYERARVTFHAHVTNVSDNPFTGAIVTQTQDSGAFRGGYDLFSARAGAALLAPLNESRKDFLYGNFMAFVGHRGTISHASAPQYDNATYIGPDFAVGYTHHFTPKLSFDMRYRALFFFPVGGAGSFGSPKTTHGPTAAISYTF